jgi:hypothetical protein
MPRLWILISQFGDSETRLGGCGLRGINYLFFQDYLKIKKGKFKVNITLGLKSATQFKARGLRHMKEEIRGLSTHSFNAAKKVLETELQGGASKESKISSRVLEEPAILSYEELGGLSDPGLRDCSRGVV